MRSGALREEEKTLESLRVLRGRASRSCEDRVAVCQPGGGLPLETKPCHTSIWDLQPPSSKKSMSGASLCSPSGPRHCSKSLRALEEAAAMFSLMSPGGALSPPFWTAAEWGMSLPMGPGGEPSTAGPCSRLMVSDGARRTCTFPYICHHWLLYVPPTRPPPRSMESRAPELRDLSGQLRV